MSLQEQADNISEKTAGFMSGATKFIKNVAGRGTDLAKQKDIISKSIKSYGQSRGTMRTMADNLNASVAKQEAIGKNMYDINLRSNNLLKTKAKMERGGYQGPSSWIKGKVKTVDINMTRKSLEGDMHKANKALEAEKLNQANYKDAYNKANYERATYVTNTKNAKGKIKEIESDVSTARKRLGGGIVGLGLIGSGAYAATHQQPAQAYYQPHQYQQPAQAYYQPQRYQQDLSGEQYKTAGLASFGSKMLKGIKATGVDAKAAYSIGKETKNFSGAAKMFGSYHPVATFSGGALAGVGATKAFSPSNPKPVNKQASLKDFVNGVRVFKPEEITKAIGLSNAWKAKGLNSKKLVENINRSIPLSTNNIPQYHSIIRNARRNLNSLRADGIVAPAYEAQLKQTMENYARHTKESVSYARDMRKWADKEQAKATHSYNRANQLDTILAKMQAGTSKQASFSEKVAAFNSYYREE